MRVGHLGAVSSASRKGRSPSAPISDRGSCPRRSPSARAGQVQRDPAGAAAELEHRPRALGGSSRPERQVGPVAAALDVVPDHALVAPALIPSRPRQAAVGEQRAQLEQRGVGGEGEQAASRRGDRVVERAGDVGSTLISSGSMPAYLRRTAISGARVPAQTTRRTAPASSSKSASQIQETSRPSAIRSLSAIQRSRPAASCARPRAAACAGPRWRPRGS